MEAVTGGVGIWTSQRRNLVLVLAVGVAIGVGVGLLLGRDATPVEAPTSTPTEGAAGPTRTVNGVPVGYARTEEGAVLAATNFALVPSSDLVREREALIKAAETFAAPSWQETAREQAERGYDFAVDRYGSDFKLFTSVVSYRMLSFTPNAASVRLWTMTVASGSQKPIAEAVWGISELHLEWVDEGDWRVRKTDTRVGPSPVVLDPAADEATQSFLEKFNEFNEGPRP